MLFDETTFFKLMQMLHQQYNIYICGWGGTIYQPLRSGRI